MNMPFFMPNYFIPDNSFPIEKRIEKLEKDIEFLKKKINELEKNTDNYTDSYQTKSYNMM